MGRAPSSYLGWEEVTLASSGLLRALPTQPGHLPKAPPSPGAAALGAGCLCVDVTGLKYSDAVDSKYLIDKPNTLKFSIYRVSLSEVV